MSVRPRKARNRPALMQKIRDLIDLPIPSGKVSSYFTKKELMEIILYIQEKKKEIQQLKGLPDAETNTEFSR